jgi:predicted RNase H-like HicB family nuclease
MGKQGESLSSQTGESTHFEIQAGKVEIMQNRYELVIYWSEEDHCFVAEVPELPGCMADGSSYQEVVRNVELIIDEWRATAQALGRPIPEPAGKLMYA